MSSIYDMNNRITQNRGLKPSARPKFKGQLREAIYSDTVVHKPLLTQFSEVQMQAAIAGIQVYFKKEKAKEPLLIFSFLVTLLIVGAILFFLASNLQLWGSF